MPAEHADPLELLTIVEVARLLKVHRGTVYKLINNHELHPVTLGRYKRIPRIELERFIADHQNGADD